MAERVLRGGPASPGLATGRVRVLSPPSGTPARDPVSPADLPAEAERARAALAGAARELQDMAAGLRASGRAAEAEIVETGALMAADPMLEGAVTNAVLERRASAASALLEAADAHAAAIAALPDPTLAARADDVRSLGRRAARLASGSEAPRPGANGVPDPTIVVADDLGPADVAELGDEVRGIALSRGAVTAHAAIVARSLGIPMAVELGPELLEAPESTELVVDGSEGEAIVDPDPRRAELARSASLERERAKDRSRAERELPAVTRDGRRIRVLVNAATAAEVSAGLAAGAEGAGLIRTELAFLDARNWPSREDHERKLAPVLAGLRGEVATVRVLDFGGDKTPPFLRGDERRGIELLLAHPQALRDQLIAIVNAARGTKLRVLLPLVRSADEVRATRSLLPSPSPLLGAMVELPEAAQTAAALAAECDFLSLGTNDLTHTTLGSDRFSAGEAAAHDPRVLRHVAATVAAGQEAGVPVEICGEAASDPLTVPLLVGLGADELSAGAARVGSVRAWVRGLSFGDASELAAEALAAPDAGAVERLAAQLRPQLEAAERGEVSPAR
jgi:phosphoenolpyruvate-protein kinase (PTS system EI component)